MKIPKCRIHFKKMIMLFAAVALLAGFMGSQTEVNAVEAHVDIRALTYKVEKNTVTITDCLEDAAGSLEIPATIDGYPVTEIGYYAFKNCSRITSIKLPESITTIQLEAFRDCSGLLSINIPAAVTYIGSEAFRNCKSLFSIAIPEGMTELKDGTFYGCASLEKVTLPNSLTKLGRWVFEGCKSLTNITIPPKVTSIELSAFEGCGLKSVVIHNGITELGQNAFYACEQLSSVQIGSGVTSIYMNAFAKCTALQEVVIPDNVTFMGSGVFAECTALKKATVSGGLKKMTYESSYQMFCNCTALETVIINEGVESTGWGSRTGLSNAMFAYCSSLKTLYLPSSLYNIADGTFYGCENITDIYYAGTAYSWGGTAMGDTTKEAFANAVVHYVPFRDVQPGAWYYASMIWAIDEGVTNGTSETTFSPDTTCTQAQILTLIYRAAGEPSVSGGNPFSDPDVNAGQYYYKAFLWAYQQGIVKDVALDPDRPCTRADVVTYLWRLNGSPKSGNSQFSDVPASADYAQAVSWAVRENITTGTSNTTFSPDVICSRAQIVTFLYRAFAK